MNYFLDWFALHPWLGICMCITVIGVAEGIGGIIARREP